MKQNVSTANLHWITDKLQLNNTNSIEWWKIIALWMFGTLLNSCDPPQLRMHSGVYVPKFSHMLVFCVYVVTSKMWLNMFI